MANSIRSELRRIVLLTSAVAVGVSCAVFMAYQWTSSRSELRLRQATLASIVADQGAAALEFDQPEPLAAILKSLKVEPTVDAAIAYTRGNRPFARYVRPGQSVPEPLARPGPDGQLFIGGDLVIVRPVESAGERVGTLAIWSNLSELTDRALLSGLTALGVLAMAGAVVVFLSARLESRVTGPVLRLGTVAREVADKRDYSVRLVPGGLAETDHLIEEFNEMLAQIQSRDAALAAAKEELERRVQERTAELELRMSELGALNKELEGFSYSVSHDLRAPLRAIDGYSKMLAEDYGSQVEGNGKRYLEVIAASARKMGQLIDDLLAFSRMGRKALEKSSIDMERMVKEVLADLRSQNPAREMEIRVGPLPPSRGDPAMFRQVFTNLLSNAIKYTRGKSPAVIEIASQSDDREVTYVVRDNGAGFSMDYAHKLFGVFQRLHSEREFEGTGVGLALVRRIIERHGGRVWAEGKVGSGAAFSIGLPKTGA